MKILVLGGGGFIGHHLINKLVAEENTVHSIDLVYPHYNKSKAHRFTIGDLRNPALFEDLVDEKYDQVYQLAADMGGAGYILSGENDADILHNSAMINLNVAYAFKGQPQVKIFFSSSACVYPMHHQENANSPNCRESNVYPANPDSDYGWEKLFSERVFMAFARNYGLNIRIARFHNIFGPENVYEGGREKAPAAICRKVAIAKDGDEVEIWGDGLQTRSFLYIDECLKGIQKLMESDFTSPVNIGSDRMVTINELAQKVISISGKRLSIHNITGPEGVRGRNSDNRLILEKLNWKPDNDLDYGLKKLYFWVLSRIEEDANEFVSGVTGGLNNE
ncbi:MAG: NAD-dependent epimerase/dehydratase family protein [Bacteroidetes bacterium]|nr:NAD-dependent epimerase/dehydratase family protein [Bacteroidota bacterium]